jgi:hypothetical protein
VNCFPFMDSAQQVIDFVKNVGVLSQPLSLSTKDKFKVVTKPVRAEGDISPVWWDVIEREELQVGSMELSSFDSKTGIAQLTFLEPINKLMCELVHDQCLPHLPKPQIGEAIEDICNLIRLRGCFGERVTPFYDDFWTIYQAGGFPCDWEGSAGNGRIIVYDPVEKLKELGRV